MTQLSKERLEALAAGQDGFNLRTATPEESMEMARRLLAVEGQVPVAYMIGGHYLMHAQDPKVDNYASAVPLYAAPQPVEVPDVLICDMCGHDAWLQGGRTYKCVEGHRFEVRAPKNEPVSQPYKLPDGYVLVPVEPTPEMCQTQYIGVDVFTGVTPDPEYYSIGGSDAAKIYRAMLAAAPQPQNAQQNIPGNIPQWIPCSERMPDANGEYYLTHSNAGVDVTYFDEGRFFDKYATHWMPLPAAPQEPTKC